MSDMYLFTISKQQYKEADKVSYCYTCSYVEDQGWVGDMLCIPAETNKNLGLYPNPAYHSNSPTKQDNKNI